MNEFDSLPRPPLFLRKGLQLIASLVEADWATLKAAFLEKRFPKTDAESLDLIAKNPVTLSRKDVDLIRRTLSELKGVTQQFEEEQGSVDSDFISSLFTQEATANSYTITANRLQDVIEIVRNSTIIAFPLRVAAVKNDNERNYLEARIISDIRPVFSSRNQIDGAPLATVVVHNLMLEFRSGEASKSMCVSLDRDDLLALHGVLERALAKDELLSERDAHKEVDQ